MNDIDIERKLHDKYLSILNMFRFVKQEAFKRAYQLATSDEKNSCIALLEKCAQHELISWVRTMLKKYHEYEYLDVRYLRDMAQDAGIKNYSTLNKIDLISLLHSRAAHGQKASIELHQVAST